jgi:Asp-tRNA(Asn)/Glu-tRNA(Gln) amidotransferase A subunit family amidase
MNKNVDKLLSLPATNVIKKIREKKLTSQEYCQACIDQIKKVEPDIKAFTYFKADQLIEKAEYIDELLQKNIKIEELEGIVPYKLCGIPVGVKDIFNTEDMPTCMGSEIWEGFTPGNDARAVTRFKRAGGISAAKTVTAEFAVNHPGPTRNPHNLNHSPGTSSSGSAAAVAAHMLPLTIGTQTAGSTIRPSSYCGIYGFKPSFGTIPRTGILKTLDTLDHVSVMARHLSDIELLFSVMHVSGWNYPLVEKHLMADQKHTQKNWRVAFLKTHTWDYAKGFVQDSMVNLADRLDKMPNIEIVDVPLPEIFKESHNIHKNIYEKALSYYFKDEYSKTPEKVSKIMKEMIQRGNNISFDTYLENADKQVVLRDRLAEYFDSNNIDAILCHSTADIAPYGLEGIEKPDPCLIWTLCGSPSLNLPLFKNNDNMPFGAQLVGRRFRDYSLMKLASYITNE